MFQPALPISGYGGWRFLSRTLPEQQASYAASPRFQRDTAYFAERIGEIGTAKALVSDRRLLSVALGAFGLGDDIDNRFFLRKVLEGGTEAPDALANRLADTRYREFSAAFGFASPSGPGTQRPGFAEKIVSAYRARGFEIAVGEQSPDLRLALNLRRELPGLAASGSTETTKWLTILGRPPLRSVFHTALGLPEGIGALDLDRQVSEFRSRARQALGTDDVGKLGGGEAIEDVVRLFLARSTGAKHARGTSPALAILSGNTGPALGGNAILDILY